MTSLPTPVRYTLLEHRRGATDNRTPQTEYRQPTTTLRQLFLIVFLILLVFLQINGEKVPVNHGAIEDGIFYREAGVSFLEVIEEQGYNLIQLTHILPFALLNLSFSAFHIVKDQEALQHGMLIWQVIYLALAVFWYFRITQKLRTKTPLMTLGFILFFFNFAWLKEVWYHPLTPDLAAFAFGMGQVNYFLRYEKFKLGMISVLGTFVSPLLLISGLLMWVLPGDKLPLFEGGRPKSAFPVILAGSVMVLLGLLGWGLWNWGSEPILNQVVRAVALIGIGGLVIFTAINNPIDLDLALVQLRKRTKPDKLNKAIMGLLGVLVLLYLLSGNNSALFSLTLLQEIGDGSMRFPLDFLVQFALHWGLLVLLGFINLSRFLQELGKQGWAVLIIFWIGSALALVMNPGSLAAWTPLVGLVLMKSLKRYRWENKELLMAGLLSLGISLSWLSVNSDALADWMLTGNNPNSLAVQIWAIHDAARITIIAYGLIGVSFLTISYLLWLRKSKYQRSMVG